jgi:hypothetical protein
MVRLGADPYQFGFDGCNDMADHQAGQARGWIAPDLFTFQMQRRFIFAVIVMIIGSAPALADVRIVSSLGGPVGSYLSFFSRVRQSGERVIIDGPCLSACTLVLSTIPRSRVCVTSRAVLGFHAPVVVNQYGRRFRSREATRAVVAAYPPRVRSWIRRHGGLSNNVILLRGSELTAVYPRCRR